MGRAAAWSGPAVGGGRRTGLTALAVLAVLGVFAGRTSAASTEELRLLLVPCPAYTCVAVRLPPELAAALAAREVPEARWRGILAVRTAAAHRADPPGPTLFGAYALAGDRLVFAPRLPLLPGDEYVALFDPGALRELAGVERDATAGPEAREELRFRLPKPSRVPPRVTAIHPAAAEVPANLLRAYVQFSTPMRPDVAAEYLRLVDAEERAIETAFISVADGLWDRDHTRLTLLFHPGRLKRGVAPHDRLGPPLAEGGRYRLVVLPGWPAATGEPLIQGAERSWRVGPADRAAVAPQRWRLEAPRAGSREPLTVRLGEPLDHALAERLITVRRGERPVPGRADLAAEGREWRFWPDAPWPADEHVLRVAPGLEDLAGNSLAALFDRGPQDPPRATAAAELRFRPTAASGRGS